MGRSKEHGEKMREATKMKILEAAVALFAEKGLAGTSTKDIAKKADVSVGLMYHYFKTKDEMFNAIIEDSLASISDFREVLNKQSFEDGVKTFAEEIIGEMKKDLSFSYWMVILAQSTDFDRQLIKELAKSSSVEKAQFFVAMMHGLCRLQVTLKNEFCIPPIDLITSFLKENK